MSVSPIFFFSKVQTSSAFSFNKHFASLLRATKVYRGTGCEDTATRDAVRVADGLSTGNLLVRDIWQKL